MFEPGTLFLGGCFLKNLYFLMFTSLLIWTKGDEMHTHFPDFQKILLTPSLVWTGRAVLYPFRREEVSENKKIPPIYQIEGEKLVWIWYSILIGKKKKTQPTDFFSVSCALIFICKDYGWWESNIECSIWASRPFVYPNGNFAI